jgi:hypothetical protein
MNKTQNKQNVIITTLVILFLLGVLTYLFYSKQGRFDFKPKPVITCTTNDTRIDIMWTIDFNKYEAVNLHDGFGYKPDGYEIIMYAYKLTIDNPKIRNFTVYAISPSHSWKDYNNNDVNPPSQSYREIYKISSMTVYDWRAAEAHNITPYGSILSESQVLQDQLHRAKGVLIPKK